MTQTFDTILKSGTVVNQDGEGVRDIGIRGGRIAEIGALSQAGAAEIISQPERFITAGDRIAVFVYARVLAKDSKEWRERRLADVYTFRDGKAVAMRAFADRQEALRWVGLHSEIHSKSRKKDARPK